MNNKDVIRVLGSIADLLQLQAADPFRVRSYERAVNTVRGLADDLNALHARGELESLPGIGKTMAAKIVELLTTGRCEVHQQLLAEVPPGLVQMLQVPDLGPKTARRLYDELGLDTIDALEAAAQAGRIRGLKGFGEKSEAKLVANIALWRAGRERVPRAVALALAEPLLAALAAAPGVVQASLAGSLRRGRDTTKDLDLLVAAEDGTAAIETFVAWPEVAEVVLRGETKATVRLSGGLNADLRVVPPDSWGAALQYFTGSQAHNIAVRARARERGMTVNEYSLRRLETDEVVASTTEEAVYGALGLAWVPPELREDRGEVAAAAQGNLPRLLETSDVRGDLHTHSRWSDGLDTIVAMARAALALGHEYLAICDHSQTLAIAHGLDEARVRAQADEIAEAQALVPGIRLLRGTEVDILSDGSLDLDLELLAELDVVVASVHLALGQDPETMTRRLVRALSSGVVDVLGHPTGRLLARREGYGFDYEAVLAVAAERQVALEINAAPERLDLDDVMARQAQRHGLPLVINTDAHATAQLSNLHYGVTQARRAWLRREDVLNAQPTGVLLSWLNERGPWKS